MEQLTLNLRHNESYLKSLFEKETGKDVSLTITNNSTSVLSVKKKGEYLSVRLHNIFLDAGADTIREITGFLKGKRGKTPFIRQFIRERRDRLGKQTARRINTRTEGRHYDIHDIYNSINKEYFEGMVAASITWGARSPKRAVRRRTLGSYSSHTNMIRINPVLDNERVPLYFIEFIVYHEMLHAHMGIKMNNGRRSVHSREFREREKLFVNYEKAMLWEKANRI